MPSWTPRDGSGVVGCDPLEGTAPPCTLSGPLHFLQTLFLSQFALAVCLSAWAVSKGVSQLCIFLGVVLFQRKKHKNACSAFQQGAEELSPRQIPLSLGLICFLG